jgi:hypothetical protein
VRKVQLLYERCNSCCVRKVQLLLLWEMQLLLSEGGAAPALMGGATPAV